MTHTDHLAPVHHEIEDHDLGLAHDLPTLLSRRGALGILGGAGALLLAACSDGSSTAGSTTTSTASAAPSTAASSPSASPSASATSDTIPTELIPEETAGPFPGDNSNGVNVLDDTGIVRQDITKSVDIGSGVAEGVPMTLRMRVLDVSGGTGAGLAGAAVYAWHCDAAGLYSMYSQGLENENYLRGVQVADADGWVTFTSIFPGCYRGRWPHVHFEVYADVDAAVSAGAKLRTSQLALPEDVSREVYSGSGYDGSTANLDDLSLDSDNVFRDGYSLQLATVEGSSSSGYTASLVVPV